MPCENCVQFKFVSIKTFFGTQLYLVICLLPVAAFVPQWQGSVYAQRLFGLKILIYFWHFTEKVCQTLGSISTTLLLMKAVEGKGKDVISNS